MKKVILSFAFLLLALRLAAVTPAPYTEAVLFSTLCSTSAYNGAMSGNLTIYAENGSPVVSGGNGAESPLGLATLRPGKLYTGNLSGGGWAGTGIAMDCSYKLNFVTPKGYQLYVNGQATDYWTGGVSASFPLNFSYTFTLALLPLDESGAALPGSFSGIGIGKAITWDAALGALRTGRTAGRIMFRQMDLTNSPATRDQLYYTPPANFNEISVIFDGPSLQRLRQVTTPQAIVDLVDETAGGYSIRYYSLSQGTWDSTKQLFTFVSQTPWRTIRVQAPSTTQLQVTETEGTVSRVSLLSLTSGTVASGTYAWKLQEGDGTTWLRTTTHTSANNGGSQATRDDVVVVYTGDTTGTVAAKTKYHYVTQPWGEAVTQVIADPDNAALTTTYAYCTDASKYGNYTRVQSIIDPTGNWTSWFYYDDWNRRGRLMALNQPWQNAPATAPTVAPDPTAAGTGSVVAYDYGMDYTGRYGNEISRKYSINGVVTGKRLTASTLGVLRYTYTGTTFQASDYSSATASQASSTIVLDPNNSNPDVGGLPSSVTRADQSQDSYLYSGGTGPLFATTVFHGTTNPAGATSVPVTSSYSPTGAPAVNIYMIPNQSTLDYTLVYYGNVDQRATLVSTSAGGSVLISQTFFTYDVGARLTRSVASNGATVNYTYLNGYLQSVVSSDGTEVDYTYDAIGRTLTMVKKGAPASGSYAAQPDLTTTYTYDGVGHVLTQTLSSSDTAETIVNTSTYDLAGRLITAQPAGLGTTKYNYDPAARTQTTTAPDTGTTIMTAQLDGRTASVTGTAVIAQYYSSGVETDGRQWSQVNAGTNNSPRLQKNWTDWLGRPIKTQRPEFSVAGSVSGGGNFVQQNTYDPVTGLLSYTTATGRAPIDYSYNTLGQLIRTGLGVTSGTGPLTLSSDDRITDQASVFYQDESSNWWAQTTTTAYPTSGSATALTTAISRTRLTGFTGPIQAEVQNTDIEGNVITGTTSVSAATKTVTTSITAPGMVKATTTVTYNGVQVAATGFDGLTSYAQVDALGRAWKSTDPRNNTTTAAYKLGTTLVSSATDAANNALSTYTYDGNGRVLTTQDALGKYTRNAYNFRGQLTNQWGDATYPTLYGYDATYGDKIALNTYRSAPATDSTTWPAVGTADTTQWKYDAASGLLWQKIDASSNTVQFDYNAAGQTATRQWARHLVYTPTAAVTTTYGYDANTGELLTTTYNDSAELIPTPPVTYKYNRLGQAAFVVDGTCVGTEKRTFNYQTAAPWRLDNETLPAYFGSRLLSHEYESANGTTGTFNGYTTGTVKGRPNGIDLGIVGNTTRDLHQYYTASNLGQFLGVTSQVGAASAQDFVYSYVASSRLPGGYTAGTSFKVSKGYETLRDVVSNVQTSWGSTSLSSFDFTYNGNRHRTTAKQSGTAFADYYAGQSYSGVYNVYGYNDRGELQTAAMYRGDSPTTSPNSADELPGRRFEYRYDSIGNRTTAGETGKDVAAGGTDDNYTANALNQYSTKTNNTVRVVGTEAANAKIAVGGAPSAGKTDRAWGADIVPANLTSAVQGNAKIYAAIVGGGTGGKDLARIDTKPYFIPSQAQNFTYDLDGNLTGDGVWTYTYDAENRLVRMQSVFAQGQILGYPRLKLDFAYDYMGRRVQKTVYNLDSSTTTLARRFLYDGWNLLAELDGTGANLKRSYTWGLDLVGDLTASGGVGALLQMYDYASNKTFYPTYDSNGNVMTLVNANTGAFAAVYEYDPYGNYLRADAQDAAVQDNPFRFSSKYTDLETGLVYYGLRYYSPNLGRFINKDPIEEAGGLNLYGFCANNAVNRWDYRGMAGLAPVSYNGPGSNSQPTGSNSPSTDPDTVYLSPFDVVGYSDNLGTEDFNIHSDDMFTTILPGGRANAFGPRMPGPDGLPDHRFFWVSAGYNGPGSASYDKYPRFVSAYVGTEWFWFAPFSADANSAADDPNSAGNVGDYFRSRLAENTADAESAGSNHGWYFGGYTIDENQGGRQVPTWAVNINSEQIVRFGAPHDGMTTDWGAYGLLYAPLKLVGGMVDGVFDAAFGDVAGTTAARAGSSATYEELLAEAQAAYPGKAGLAELHHITPKYLGGAANGPLIELDAAYHQQITNQFRSLWPYGGPKPGPQQLEEILQQVYQRFPLPSSSVPVVPGR